MCWQNKLEQKLTEIRNKHIPPRAAIIGIGHELHGDDAAGVLLSRALKNRITKDSRLLVIEAGQSPENFSGTLRRFRPHLVVMVDAAWMGSEPGIVQWLPWQEAGGTGILTHGLPIKDYSNYLATELDCEISLIGIQPANTSYLAPLSETVKSAIETTTIELANLLKAWLQPTVLQVGGGKINSNQQSSGVNPNYSSKCYWRETV